MKIVDIQAFANHWRQKNPSVYGEASDEQIINHVRDRYPGLGVPSYQEALQTSSGDIEVNYDNDSLINTKTDPDSTNSWFLTGDFIPDSWQQEGVAGISADFWRSSYNESMAGEAYKSFHGHDKWETNPGYDPSWYAQAGQFLVGMMSPLDMGIMLSTGALGKGAALVGKAGIFGRGVGKKFLSNGLMGSYASKNPKMGSAAINLVEGALTLGVGGGSFSATHALVRDVATQREGNPNVPINIKQALKAGSDEFLHSFPMFAISGGVTQGIMGPIYGYAQAYGKATDYSTKVAKALTNPVAQLGTEAALFTSLPSALGDEDAPKFWSKEWLAGLGTNAIVIGGMRAIGGFQDAKYVDAKKLISNEIKLSSRETKSVSDAVNNVKNNIGADAPKAVITELNGIARKALLTKSKLNSDINQISKDLDFISEMRNVNLKDKAFLEKSKVVGSKENAMLVEYIEKAPTYATAFNGLIDDLLSNPTKIKEAFKNQEGREPTASELLRFEKSLENIKKNTNTKKEFIDDYWNGAWTKSNDGKTGGETKKELIDDVRTIVGGRTRETASGWGTSYIIEKAKKWGVEYELTASGKQIKNKKQVIEDIFNAKKGKQIADKKLAEAGVAQTPSMFLTKALTEINIEQLKTTPAFNRKIKTIENGKTKFKDTVKDYITSLKLDKANEQMLYQGISEFMQIRKSNNAPGNFKVMADYAKWLESKGKKLNEATRDLTDIYVKEQQAKGNLTKQNQRSYFNNSLSSFYGAGDAAGGAGGLKTGFAYKYMGTENKTPSISQTGIDRAGTAATPERIALVKPEEYGLVRAKNKELVDAGTPLKGKDGQKVDPLTYDVATELLYNFGARGIDSLKRLYIQNIDVKNGIIREWSAGAGQKGAGGPRFDIPIQKMLPELWDKIVKVIGNRKKGNLLKGLDGKNLRGESINVIEKLCLKV